MMHTPIEMLRAMQWEGYSTEDGERACPCCGAWKYQPREKPIHAYACGLAVLIGAEMETQKSMTMGEYCGSSERQEERTKEYDVDVLPGGIGEIAGASMLGDIGACDGELDFDSPTPEDLYVAAIVLASELVQGEPTTASRKIERAALWLARVAATRMDKTS